MKKHFFAIAILLLSFSMQAQSLSGALRTKNTELDTDGWLGFGDQSTTGDWRFTVVNDTIARQRFNGSVWVTVPFGSGGGSDGNDFVTSGSFNTSNGLITLTIPNQADVVFNTTGRYSLGSHTHSLVSLDDVTITSIANGELLKWNGSAWINNTLAEVGIEAAFSKNTAFNKNYGTTAGTVAQGNDSRILNGQTAFGWGNHASAGYLTSYTETQDLFDVLANGSTGNFADHVTIISTGSNKSFNVDLFSQMTLGVTGVMNLEAGTTMSLNSPLITAEDSSNVYFPRGLRTDDTGDITLGVDDTDGSWRMRRNGTALVFERHNGTSWIELGRFEP